MANTNSLLIKSLRAVNAAIAALLLLFGASQVVLLLVGISQNLKQTPRTEDLASTLGYLIGSIAAPVLICMPFYFTWRALGSYRTMRTVRNARLANIACVLLWVIGFGISLFEETITTLDRVFTFAFPIFSMECRCAQFAKICAV